MTSVTQRMLSVHVGMCGVCVALASASRVTRTACTPHVPEQGRLGSAAGVCVSGGRSPGSLLQTSCR